jgi:hypothetical protein
MLNRIHKLSAILGRSLFTGLFALACASTFAQSSSRSSAPAAAPRATTPAPATAGLLLSQADAARVLAGYWRVQWGADDAQIGILHITAVGASENQVLVEGQYSPDGLNICATTGTWTYNSRVSYSANGTVENYELPNLMRIKVSCPNIKKEYVIETVVVVGSPSIHFVGRALVSQPDRRVTTSITLSRFNAQM